METVVSVGIESITRIMGLAAYGMERTSLRARPAREELVQTKPAAADFETMNQVSTLTALETQRQRQQLPSEDPREEDENSLEQLIADTNASLSMANRSLRFRINRETDDIQIQVVDTDRDRVIRSIPTDEMINLAARMREFSGIGAMVDQSR